MKKKRNVIKSYTIELDLIHALNVPLQKHLMEAFSSLEPVLMECHKRMSTRMCYQWWDPFSHKVATANNVDFWHN
jgi:hypothetical protein